MNPGSIIMEAGVRVTWDSRGKFILPFPCGCRYEVLSRGILRRGVRSLFSPCDIHGLELTYLSDGDLTASIVMP